MLSCPPLKPGIILFRPPQTDGALLPRLDYASKGRGRIELSTGPQSRIVHLAPWNQISFDAKAECWEHGLDIAITRGARISALLASQACIRPERIQTRRHLYRRQRDPAWNIATVRNIIDAKIGNQFALLRLYHDRPAEAWNEKGATPTAWGDHYPDALASLRADRLTLPSRTTIDSLRGLEGHAAMSYFSSWPALLGRSSFRRQARTARDPINLLLDMTYARLAQLVTLHLLDADFDPAAGMLHVDTDDRPSLALDLMEPLRPLIADRFVLRWFRREPQAWCIETPSGKWSTTPHGRKLFRERWSSWLYGNSDRQRPGMNASIQSAVKGFQSWLIDEVPIDWPRVR